MKNTASIVLVHGLFGSQNDPRILEAFGKNAVFAPDMLGYGEYRHHDMLNLKLSDQADHVANFIDNLNRGPVHLVGHSVGGAIATLVALRNREKLLSLTSVEGNFTLKDAFWSKELSLKTDDEVVQIIQSYADNPRGWFENAGVAPSTWSDQLAQSWLDNQPATTIKAQAAAVVAATEDASYLDGLKELMLSGFPVNLIAGERASTGWDTPLWANQYCHMRANIRGVGHLMMAENPVSYAAAVMACVEHSERASLST